jgi:hypothetical protein
MTDKMEVFVMVNVNRLRELELKEQQNRRLFKLLDAQQAAMDYLTAQNSILDDLIRTMEETIGIYQKK